MRFLIREPPKKDDLPFDAAIGGFFFLSTSQRRVPPLLSEEAGGRSGIVRRVETCVDLGMAFERITPSPSRWRGTVEARHPRLTIPSFSFAAPGQDDRRAKAREFKIPFC
jgi:hypothetical protein